jgi:hypothetical protein
MWVGLFDKEMLDLSGAAGERLEFRAVEKRIE